MRRMIKKLAVVLSVTLVCAPMGALAGNKLIVKDAGGTTDVMVVSDTGLIGSGTSTPSAGVTVRTSLYPANTFRVEGVDYSGGFIAYLVKPGTTLPITNERLGFIYMGSIYNGVTAMNATGMRALAESDWTPTSTPSAFAFETTANNTTRLERMRIASTGNVGIGITNPTQKLEIDGGIRLNTAATKPACSAATRGTLWFEMGTTADILYVCSQTNGTLIWKVATLN